MNEPEKAKQLASRSASSWVMGQLLCVWLHPHPPPQTTQQQPGRACRLRADHKTTPPSAATAVRNTRVTDYETLKEPRPKAAGKAAAYLCIFRVLQISISCRTSNFFSVYKHWQETPPEVLTGQRADWSDCLSHDWSRMTHICGHDSEGAVTLEKDLYLFWRLQRNAGSFILAWPTYKTTGE